MPILLLLAALGITPATDKPTPIDWTIPEGATNISRIGQEISIDGVDGPSTTQVINLSSPNVPSHEYMLTGRVKYAGVEGVGYIEMWNYFADGGMYFTRTLAPGGPMGQVTGNSDWRDLVLPFYSKAGYLPNRITVAVVLPGKGKVWLEPLTLKAIPSSTASQAWLVGVIAGLVTTIWMTALIVLTAFRNTRRFAIGVAMISLVVGAIIVSVALLAWQQEWPISITQSLLVTGLTIVIGSAIFIPALKAFIAKDELRTMRALDAELG